MVLPPWWVLAKVKPEGPEKDMGSWKAVTFSEAQQKQFSVDVDGKVLDQEKHTAALQALKESGTPPPLKKPKFIQVAKIEPEMKGVNLHVKVVKSEAAKDERFHEVQVGDASGVITLRARGDQVATCTVGECLRIQNAKCVMIKGYMRLDVDKWGVLKKHDGEASFEPNVGKDMSALEYELS